MGPLESQSSLRGLFLNLAHPLLSFPPLRLPCSLFSCCLGRGLKTLPPAPPPLAAQARACPSGGNWALRKIEIRNRVEAGGLSHTPPGEGERSAAKGAGTKGGQGAGRRLNGSCPASTHHWHVQ